MCIRDRATCWFYKPDHYFNSAPWRKQKGAGPIYVNLIHDIDLLRYFCGDVRSVFAYGVPSKRGYENEDVASILLKFENDITAIGFSINKGIFFSKQIKDCSKCITVGVEIIIPSG